MRPSETGRGGAATQLANASRAAHQKAIRTLMRRNTDAAGARAVLLQHVWLLKLKNDTLATRDVS